MLTHPARDARAYGLRLNGGAQNRLVARTKIGRDAEIERRLRDPFELVREIFLTPVRGEPRGLGLSTPEKALADPSAHAGVAYDDEHPGL